MRETSNKIWNEDLFMAWAVSLKLEPVCVWMFKDCCDDVTDCLLELSFTQITNITTVAGNRLSYMYGVMPREYINIAREIKGITCVARIIGCHNPY